MNIVVQIILIISLTLLALCGLLAFVIVKAMNYEKKNKK